MRDTGSQYDGIPEKLIKTNQLDGGVVWFRQPPMNNIRRLPTADVTLEIEGRRSIKTKAIVTDKQTNMSYYIFENET